MMDVSEETRLLNGTILTSRFFCSRLCQRIRGSKKTAVAVMFIAFMLDLMLLTVVEPLLPDIIRSLTVPKLTASYGSTSVPPITERGNLSNVPYLPVEGDTSVSAIAVGVLNGAKPLTQVILNPFIGAIVDRTGHTFPMLLGFIVAFLATLGFAFAQSYALLMCTRCFQGLGSSLMTISGLAMLSSVYQEQEERGRAMGVAFSGLAFGLIVGFPMGSFLYQFAGREVPFLCLAGLILLGALIRFGMMPIFITSGEDKISGEKGQETTCAESCSVFLDCYILAATGVYFWLCYGVGTVTGIGPLYMQEVLNAEQWQIGVVFLVGAIAQNITQYCMAMWSYKIGWWLTSMVGLIILAVGMITYTLPTRLWFLLLPQSVYAGGLGFVMGSIPPLLGHLADIRVNSLYGAVFALSDTGTNLGYFLGSTITGLLVEKFNYFISFSVMGVVIAIYSLVCLVLRNIPEKTTALTEEERQVRLHTSWRKANRHSLSFSMGD